MAARTWARAITTYMGDSRGHWEGNTLVVETTNLKAQPGAGGGLFTDAAVLTERFTRTSPNELELRPDGERSQNLDQALDHSHAVQAGSQLQDLRVRLPRRQLHDAGRAQWRSRSGEEGRVDARWIARR